MASAADHVVRTVPVCIYTDVHVYIYIYEHVYVYVYVCE